MTTTTHTPGPWATYINGGKDGWIANAEGDLIACAVRDDTMAANARLIAAAPDLLAALQGLVGNKPRGPYKDINAALDAIAKAKGE